MKASEMNIAVPHKDRPASPRAARQLAISVGAEDAGGWSPYVAGALSGLLVVFAVLTTGNYFGASTSFVRLVGMVEMAFDPARTVAVDYFARYAPIADWQFLFVAGIMIGSLISSTASGSFRWQGIPDMWLARFGGSRTKRALVAFLGGVVAMFGARLAGGCTSGHGLSGTLQLAVSGFIVMASLFAGGMLAAHLIYKGGTR